MYITISDKHFLSCTRPEPKSNIWSQIKTWPEPRKKILLLATTYKRGKKRKIEGKEKEKKVKRKLSFANEPKAEMKES